MGDTRVAMPARSVLGQAVDLGCVRDGAGFGGDPLVREDCLGRYDLAEPGSYRVIVEYFWEDTGALAGSGGSVEADTITGAVQTSPSEGRWLADSVVITVAER